MTKASISLVESELVPPRRASTRQSPGIYSPLTGKGREELEKTIQSTTVLAVQVRQKLILSYVAYFLCERIRHLKNTF